MPIMYDAIYPSNLPAGGDAYLGYADGRWPDYAAIAAKENVPVYALTVFGSDGVGSGVDCEPGDATVQQAAQYIKDTIAAGRVDRPIAYVMESWAKPLVDALNALGVDRTAYRLLTAHYAGKHICGPGSCGSAVQADGTQWNNAGPYDESYIDDHFLGAAPHPGVDEVTPQDITNITNAVLAAVQPELNAIKAQAQQLLNEEAITNQPELLKAMRAANDLDVVVMPAVRAQLTALATAVEALKVQIAALPVISLKGETATIAGTVTF